METGRVANSQTWRPPFFSGSKLVTRHFFMTTALRLPLGVVVVVLTANLLLITFFVLIVLSGFWLCSRNLPASLSVPRWILRSCMESTSRNRGSVVIQEDHSGTVCKNPLLTLKSPKI